MGEGCSSPYIRTPHPTEYVEPSELPSPTRGEGAITSTALAGIWAPTMDQSAAEVFDRSIETGRFSIPRRANSLHGGVTSVRAVLHVSDIGADDHQIGTQQA